MIKLKITWRYCIAFYCLGMLYASLHELIHHFVGYLVCGSWGIKTFNYFETTCESLQISYIATYAGPIFSFLMMYVGVYFLRKNSTPFKKHLGFALIFSQLPLQRMINPIFRMNDEYYATSQLFGHTEIVYWSVILIIWLICIPPLIKAYRVIENKYRLLWFIFYLGFFPYLLIGPFFFGLEYLMVEKNILSQPIIGIGLLFIINEIVTVIGYVLTKKHLHPK